MEKTNDGANVRFPPPLIYVLVLAFGVAMGRMFNLPGLGLGLRMRDLFGGGFVVVGFLLSFAGAGVFLRRGTAIIPFKPASQLVTSGVYRWTRNPMYLGMALIYVGLSLVLDSVAALVLLTVVIAIVHRRVIAREEAYLKRAFGNEYVAYKKRVRPWI